MWFLSFVAAGGILNAYGFDNSIRSWLRAVTKTERSDVIWRERQAFRRMAESAGLVPIGVEGIV